MPMIDRLVALPALADIPRDQLQWLLDHGDVCVMEDGGTLRNLDDGMTGLFLVISGRFSVRVEQGGVEREVREITPGRVTGYLPYSRMKNPRGYLVADGPVEFVRISVDDLPELTRACYEFTGMCVHEMLERVRVFKADDKRQEKMAALGRLSAGLAHELNNPAAAAARAARELDAAQLAVVAAAHDLGAAGLGERAREALASLEAVARTRRASLSPMALSELEDRLADWLHARGINGDLAYPLADGRVTAADLEAAAPAFEDDQLALVLRYVSAVATVRALTADITAAAERVHSLVAAVKKHTHMDRAALIEPIRLEQHLADTVQLMRSKASAKDVSLELHTSADLPAVEGSVAELNQVWLHLVDNAIDAVAGPGRIEIDAKPADGTVVVCVTDDGAGIPAELQERVFEPFFTTKDVGEGRGLGLDIVRTVVRAHRGAVELSSVPGRTVFRVTLPASKREAIPASVE